MRLPKRLGGPWCGPLAYSGAWDQLAGGTTEAGVHVLSSAGIGGAPNPERVPFDTRKASAAVPQSRGSYCGDHPVHCVDTNRPAPMHPVTQIKLAKDPFAKLIPNALAPSGSVQSKLVGEPAGPLRTLIR